MKVRSEYKDSCYVDIDDTTVRWVLQYPELRGHPDIFTVIDPYDDEKIELVPIFSTIKIIRDMHKNGKKVYAWSHGGALWAETVFKALKLDHLVTGYLTKPTWMLDDMSPYVNFNYAWIPINKEDK